MEKKISGGAWLCYAAVFAAVVALDQWFKRWITANIPQETVPAGNRPLLPGVVHLTHIHNGGAAFGSFQGGRWFFLALLALFCGLVIWALRTGWLEDGFSRFLAVLAAAGAVGNGIDRALHGYVVDMFELEFMRFAVFNIADIALTVSAALFMLHLLLHWRGGESAKA